MKEYEIVVILWNDHIGVNRESLPKNPNDLITPVLSIGIITQETSKLVVLVNGIERYEERDDASYIIILKATIVSRKVYGKIKIQKPRRT